MKKTFQLFVFCFFLLPWSLACHLHAQYVESEDFEDLYARIYVEAQDLCVCEEGLFLQTETGYIQLKSISSDENGLFVEPRGTIKFSKDLCFGGHQVCHSRPGGCGGCAVQ